MLTPSSTSFPSERVEVVEVRVEECRHRPLIHFDELFVRFRFDKVDAMDVPAELYDRKVLVSAVVEAAPRSWTQADRIGSTVFIYKGSVLLHLTFNDADDPNAVMHEAFRKAMGLLNDPFEAAATLYGIKHNADVHIEHKLRINANDFFGTNKLGHLLQRKSLPPFFQFDK